MTPDLRRFRSVLLIVRQRILTRPRRLSLALCLVVLAALSARGARGEIRFGETSRDRVRENLDLPFNAVGESAEEDELAPEILVFHGGVYEADAFCFCLDRSQSQAGAGGWQALRRERERVIAELSAEAEFGIVFFGANVAAFPENRRAARATRANKAAALRLIRETEPESWTCMLPGLRDALTMANSCERARRVLIVMTDGKPTCPGVSYFRYVEEILAEARSRNHGHVEIDTVGTGLDVNEPFLRQLANEHRGSYRRIWQ